MANRAITLMLSMSVVMAAWGTVALAASDKTYKWVDDKGVIHYSDKVPLDAAGREQTVLDKQARPVQKIEAVSVDEQRKLSEEEAERLRIEQQKKEIAERKDRALLLSYLSDKDIDFARDRALTLLDAQIESSQAMLGQQQARHKELLERQEAGKAIPEGELEKLETDIMARNAGIERYKKEKETTYAKYEQDKQRWRELKAAEKARNEAAAAKR